MKVINEVELASDLAEGATHDELIASLVYSEEMEWVTDEDGNKSYTEGAQDIFNRWYDYFGEMIENCEESV